MLSIKYKLCKYIANAFSVLIFIFATNGCKMHIRDANQQTIDLGKKYSYKVRALKISADEFNFEHRITYRNIFYEPTVQDLLNVNMNSKELEKYFLEYNTKLSTDSVQIVEFHNSNKEKIYIFYNKADKWCFSYRYILGEPGIENGYTEPGMQEFERIVEQLECQKEKRGLLND